MRVGRGLKASLDVGRERGDRRESLAPDLVALDAERELFFQCDDQLEGVDRVEPSPSPNRGMSSAILSGVRPSRWSFSTRRRLIL
jgi:hypothetical protein